MVKFARIEREPVAMVKRGGAGCGGRGGSGSGSVCVCVCGGRGEEIGRTGGVDDERFVAGGAGDGEDALEGGEEGGAVGDAEGRREEVGRLGVDDEQHGVRWGLHVDRCLARFCTSLL